MGHEAADAAEGAVGDVEVAVEHRVEGLGLDGELPWGCSSLAGFGRPSGSWMQLTPLWGPVGKEATASRGLFRG
jgi:hypothetical protein